MSVTSEVRRGCDGWSVYLDYGLDEPMYFDTFRWRWVARLMAWFMEDVP